jgi:hypothetical protein
MRDTLRRADYWDAAPRCLNIKDRLDHFEGKTSALAMVLTGSIACELDCAPMNGDVSLPHENVVYFQVLDWMKDAPSTHSCIYGLMLEPTGNTKVQYRRIGRVLIPSSLAEDCGTEDIMIV